MKERVFSGAVARARSLGAAPQTPSQGFLLLFDLSAFLRIHLSRRLTRFRIGRPFLYGIRAPLTNKIIHCIGKSLIDQHDPLPGLTEAADTVSVIRFQASDRAIGSI